MWTRRILLLAGVMVFGGAASAQVDDMLRNGGFEDDADGDGMADDWQFAGDEGAKATWSRDAGVEGRYSQKLACSSFAHLSPASHVMLAQLDTFALEQGQWYQLSLRVKGERLPGNTATVAIQQTGPWEQCGLYQGFRVTPEWRLVECPFQATRSVDGNVRLQIWYAGTGTLWVDDVRLVPRAPLQSRYLESLPDLGGRNLIPNGGFECGTSGWGSIATTPGWAGNLNSLYGAIDPTGGVGSGAAMRVDLDRAQTPVFAFDYYEAVHAPALDPLLANRGWVTVEPGAEYTLSADVKADPAGVPCAMAVQQAFAGQQRQGFAAGRDWQRARFTFRPSAGQVFVAIGPDLRESDLAHATVWVDNVQLERGTEATDYGPRSPVEVGVEWEYPGHLFEARGGGRCTVTASNATGAERSVSVAMRLADSEGRETDGPTANLRVPAAGHVRQAVDLGLTRKGAYRLTLLPSEGALIPTRPERLALIERCRDRDGLFGMNHGYPWPQLNRLSQDFGLTWFRDWSLKWGHAEPEKGRFAFAEADYQVDRMLALDLRLIGLLPFPSSDWCSSAPESVTGAEYARAAYMPRDLDEYATYVRATVRHYAGRIHVWEILNEPIYTDYALPRANGYTPADYVKLLEVAYRAVKDADPEALVVGGIAGPPDAYTGEFLDAGGLQWVDMLNLHIYPGLAEPESYLEGLQKLNEAMDKAGGKKPLWFTEGAYYADDDPPSTPHRSWMQLLGSERECAEYQARFDIVLLSQGVRKIIYHSGTCGTLNDEGLESIFFEWDGAPRAMVASQAALTALLGPDTEPLGSLSDRARLFGFRSRGRAVVVAWSETPDEVTLTPSAGARVLDLMGNEVPAGPRTLTGSPCYLVLEGGVDATALRALAAEWVGER
jgi:hypothetical protein